MNDLEVPPAKRKLATVSDAGIASTCNANVPEVTKTATCFWKVFKSFCEEKVVIDLATCCRPNWTVYFAVSTQLSEE